jgi:type II secretory pathway pseudopilin PulG
MNGMNTRKGDSRGMTLFEILLSIIVIAISATVFITWQQISWTRTKNNNRLMIAGQIIEKQIEQRRLIIARNPAVEFENFKTMHNTTVVDNSVTPPVSVLWLLSPAFDPNGSEITNVKKVELVATWGSGPDNELRVFTCIAKDF